MTRNSAIAARVAMASVGGALLLGVGGAAFADELQQSDGVEVLTTIEPLTGPGTLAMTVAASSTTLTEGVSDDTHPASVLRCPPVGDHHRHAHHDPEGAAWAVVGQASDLVSTDGGGQPAISAGYLGWTPSVVDPGETYEVLPGDQVDTILDDGPNNVGLEGIAGPELLAMTLNDSATTQAVAGSWTANAGLFLKVPLNTPAGAYSSVLTLSLFE